jgi:hypothetical protein
MPRRLLVLLLAVLSLALALAATAPAQIASTHPQTYERWTMERTGPVQGSTTLKGYGRAYALLPGSWSSNSRNGQTRIRFRVRGSCGVGVDVWVGHVLDRADETAAERAKRRRPNEEPFLYGSGSRDGGGAWRVVKPASTIVRGIYEQPLAANWPGVPAGQRVWLEVQATAKATRSCHTGGIREAVAFPLVTAFAAMSGTGVPR